MSSTQKIISEMFRGWARNNVHSLFWSLDFGIFVSGVLILESGILDPSSSIWGVWIWGFGVYVSVHLEFLFVWIV